MRPLFMVFCVVFIAVCPTFTYAQKDWSIVFSAAYLVNASAGAMIAIRNDLRQEPFGIRTGRSAKDDFWLGPVQLCLRDLLFLLHNLFPLFWQRAQARPDV